MTTAKKRDEQDRAVFEELLKAAVTLNDMVNAAKNLYGLDVHCNIGTSYNGRLTVLRKFKKFSRLVRTVELYYKPTTARGEHG